MTKCKYCGEDPCGSPGFCDPIKEADKKRDTDKAEAFGILDGDGWNDPPPPQEWTVDQRFPRNETTLFSGNGGAGKSTIGLQLCCAHVIGKDWMGALPERGPALFVDAEDHADVIRRRTYDCAQHYGVKPSDLFDGGLKIVSLHGKDAILAKPAKGLIAPTGLYKKIEEAAALFEPQTVVLASAANFFGGNEIDRSQVTQFIGLMNRLAVAANGSTILISHPSVLGMESDSGLSGSTQWHNAVRARMYLVVPKPKKDDDAQPNGDGAHEPELRRLEFRKNQYGPQTAAIAVRWKNGLFLPDSGPSSFDKAIRDSQADDGFRSGFGRLEQEGFVVSATPKANNYAPKVLAEAPEAAKYKLTKDELAAAMNRALASGFVHIATYGRPSKPNYKLAGGNGRSA